VQLHTARGLGRSGETADKSGLGVVCSTKPVRASQSQRKEGVQNRLVSVYLDVVVHKEKMKDETVDLLTSVIPRFYYEYLVMRVA